MTTGNLTPGLALEKGSISIYFVQAALEPVRARGLDADALLREAGISPALLQSVQGRVSAHSFSALWLGVARVLDDELFGQDTRRMKVGSFAMLCQVLVHCDTLQAALVRMTRFFNLLLDDFQCRLEVNDHEARLVLRVTPDARAPRVFGQETLLILQYGVACWLVGRRLAVREARFAYPPPPRRVEYTLMYSPQLQFDAAVTALVFDAALLALPVVQNAQTARDYVRMAPANVVLKYKNNTGHAAQIRRRLGALPCAEWPAFEAFAAQLHMTPTTLRRRLEDEGQSFQAIKDALRRDIAIDALCHTPKSVMAIALELGFAEVGAFYRAFKKWTGLRPGEYRQRMHEG